jgi:hypothetical protein
MRPAFFSEQSNAEGLPPFSRRSHVPLLSGLLFCGSSSDATGSQGRALVAGPTQGLRD